jgi:hypothetical protein
MHIGYWWESQKEKDHQEDHDVSGLNNIKMNLGVIGSGGMDWIDLAEDRDHCRALMNTIMNHRVR